MNVIQFEYSCGFGSHPTIAYTGVMYKAEEEGVLHMSCIMHHLFGSCMHHALALEDALRFSFATLAWWA